ncbi:hypothetical protein PspLS_05921 [Pyricularia sp. CBS 133598]|nr:hypothetical protein PspLS_05921 [Pyricularia sp. CBS 133598]
MSLPTHFELSNGQKIPAVGLGTFQSEADNARVKEAVKAALEMGYRHIDGAHAYGNEKQIGEAIKESGIPRKEIFVTSKLAQTWHEPGDVERALEVSLRDLQLDYGKILEEVLTGPSELLLTKSFQLQLTFILCTVIPHAYKAGENNEAIRHPSGNGKPVIDYDLSRRYPETWKAMERLVDSGKAKAIGKQPPISLNTFQATDIWTGVCNFNILKTQRLLATARIKPAVNQVELHPYLPQHELMDFSAKHGILLVAHQPLGGRPVPAVRGHPDQSPPTDDQRIVDVASSCGMSPAQVCLSWLVQKGIPVIPKSSQTSHLRSNMEVRKLSDELFNIVDGLAASRAGGPVRFLDPSRHIGFDIFDEENDQPIADAARWD